MFMFMGKMSDKIIRPQDQAEAAHAFRNLHPFDHLF